MYIISRMSPRYDSYIGTVTRWVFLLMLAVWPHPLAAQSTAPEPIDGILDRAMAAADTYRTVFRDLVAEETRVGERFDKKGKVAESRRIVSDLLIHRTSGAPEADIQSAEYRNVREVDGKAIKDAADRVARLSRELSEQRSVQDQLKQIRKESTRYDLGACAIEGATLNMGRTFIVRKDARPSFDFSVVGRDRIHEHDVIIISYLQNRPVPGVTWNFKFRGVKTMPKSFERGRLWIDPESGFIWREESDVMVQPAGAKSSAPLIQHVYEYSPSRFEIPVPAVISMTCNMEVAVTFTKTTKTSITGRMIARYGAFQRFGADVELKPALDQ